ncbi:sulfotransferase family protein [Nocardioides terrigena]|uniref:sulfotransferase family protein n=1 Tax=Nocardioides terrigena TaxID=424797 RepID=UPI000D2F48A5|nr:sulfotransferase [Nocardioides terrigena]
MSIRTVAPHRVKALGRVVSVRVGSATAGHRQLPSFVLVGAQRAGTTSFFRALQSHPLVHSANYHKGVNYFDVNYDKGFAWYQGHFPTTSYLQRRTHANAGEPMTFEASGYYMFHPRAAERIARDLPDVRILMMLRDPVERAYSAWKHEHARGFETESFERALELEEQRLDGEVERMCLDDSYQSARHRHQAYRLRGEYADQLLRMRDFIPHDRIHVIESESFFEHPEATYGGVLEFLGLPQVMPDRFDRWNGRPSSPMLDTTRAQLHKHFEPHDRALARLLEREPAWLS